MDEFFYNGIWRMDWGLGNPNKTAALIATLMIAVWGIACIRRWGFWAALALFTGLGICLVHTFSRGGLLATVAGLAIVVWHIPRPYSRKQIAAAIVAIGVIAAASIYLAALHRYGQGLSTEDRSITNRLALWRTTPAMMVAAPTGWGLGNSGQVYMQWYQPVDRAEEYRTLVNSHLTWLVELGWPGRFLYILGWLIILTLCWPSANHRWRAIALGVWIAFGVAAFFSSVAESGWLWIVPGLSLLVVLGHRTRAGDWPKTIGWIAPFGAAGVMTLGLFILGQSHSEIRGTNGAVILGRGNPEVWLVADTQTLGLNYGKTLRRFRSSSKSNIPTLGVVESLELLRASPGQTVILSCNPDPDQLPAVALLIRSSPKVILLNPRFFPQELQLTSEQARKVTAIFGEFSQSPAATTWAETTRVKRVTGAGDFLPTWPQAVWSPDP